MSFHEVRLPEAVERGAQGGPMFRTTVITLSSGHEKRNRDWQRARHRWDIGYGLLDGDGAVDETTVDTVLAFFYARQGRAFGFRFKDWTDCTADRQAIGVIDGTNASFQVFKRYASGGFAYDRPLRKPVAGTVDVWVDGVAITEGLGDGDVRIDPTTGLVTLGPTLAAQTGTEVEAACAFDVPVRFDVDHLQLTALRADLAAVPNLPVVELLPTS